MEPTRAMVQQQWNAAMRDQRALVRVYLDAVAHRASPEVLVRLQAMVAFAAGEAEWVRELLPYLTDV